MEEAGPRTLKRNKGNKFGLMDRPFSMDCTLKRILVKKGNKFGLMDRPFFYGLHTTEENSCKKGNKFGLMDRPIFSVLHTEENCCKQRK